MMSNETFILVEHINYASLATTYSAPIKGAGYNYRGSMHTFTYELENFNGSIVLQGTLELSPTEHDWADIEYTTFISDGSTDFAVDNFEGNWVWLRAKYFVESGIIHQVRCNI